MQLMALAGLAGAIGAVAFALQNDVPVTVTFMLWRYDGSLAMVLLLSLALGALLMALITTPTVLRLQWRSASQQRQLNALEAANEELRAPAGAAGSPAPDPSAPSLADMAPRTPPRAGR